MDDVYTHRKWWQLLCSAAVLLAMSFATAVAQGRAGPYSSVMDVLKDPSLALSSFKQLVDAAGLNSTLSTATFSGTGFIPHNAALQVFIEAQGYNNVSALVAELNATLLQNFVKFHFLTASLPTSNFSDLIKGVQSSTLLSAEYLSAPSFTLIRCNETSEGMYEVFGRDSTVAPVITPNITVNNGTSYIHVINGTLAYWYKDLESAANALNFSMFYSTLVVAANTSNPALMSNGETRMFFAPTDNAMTNFEQQYPVQFGGNNLSAIALDIIANHVANATGGGSDLPQENSKVTFSTFSSQAAGNTIVLGTTVTNRSSSHTLWYTVVYDAMGFGISSQADSTCGRVPVGGIVPSSYVYVLTESPILPVYPSIMSYLYSVQPTSTVSFNSFIGFLGDQAGALDFQNPTFAVTLLAPLDTGVNALLAAYNVSSLAKAFGGLSSTSARNVLNVHLLEKVMTRSQFTNNTFYGAWWDGVTSIISPSGTVTIVANQTNATLSPLVVDVPIFYGRSYVQGINYVLVPSGVTLPAGGGGGSPAPGSANSKVPSLLFMALSFIFACCWMTLPHVGVQQA